MRKDAVIPESPRISKATTAAEPTPGGHELTSIYFDFDSTITAKAEYTLQKHAEWLKRNRDYDVKIEGHRDRRGNEDYNMDLGQGRRNPSKKRS
jgi:outer membrane protein OmpA-like peptidoglycan-associated protein